MKSQKIYDLIHSSPAKSSSAVYDIEKSIMSYIDALENQAKIRYFNSPDHDSTLTNVAAGKGICLAPGFLNDHSGQFAWIPYDCEECFHLVLCTHKTDSRKSLINFITVLQKLYSDAVAFPF